MNVFARIATALNQSFRLVFDSISKGMRMVYHGIKKTINIVSELIKNLHDLIATIVQLLINISSMLFVVFIPFGFFFDPLDWSRFLYGILDHNTVFLIRIAIGSFFLLVAYLLLSSLWKSWQESDSVHDGEEIPHKKDFVKTLSSLISWLIIAAVFIYFTIYRYFLIGVDLSTIEIPYWLKP